MTANGISQDEQLWFCNAFSNLNKPDTYLNLASCPGGANRGHSALKCAENYGLKQTPEKVYPACMEYRQKQKRSTSAPRGRPDKQRSNNRRSQSQTPGGGNGVRAHTPRGDRKRTQSPGAKPGSNSSQYCERCLRSGHTKAFCYAHQTNEVPPKYLNRVSDTLYPKGYKPHQPGKPDKPMPPTRAQWEEKQKDSKRSGGK